MKECPKTCGVCTVSCMDHDPLALPLPLNLPLTPTLTPTLNPYPCP